MTAIIALFALAASVRAIESTDKPVLPDFDKLWNYNDPAGTEKEFRKLLDPAAASGDDTYYYALQTQIARCQGLQGKYDDAHKTLDRVEKVIDARDLPLVKVRYLLERGRVYNSSGSTQSAARIFEEAHDLAVKQGAWNFAVDAAHMVAIAEQAPTDQVRWNLAALKLTEDHADTARWRPSIWNNLGEAYRSKRDYDKALECFQNIIKYQAEQGKPVWRYARVDEAKMLRTLGRTGESMPKIKALYDEVSAAGETDGVVCEEYAETLLATGEESAAKEQFAKAWEKLKDEQWLKDAEPQRYERLKRFGTAD